MLKPFSGLMVEFIGATTLNMDAVPAILLLLVTITALAVPGWWLLRRWIDYRVKLRLLASLEQNPDLLQHFPFLSEEMEQTGTPQGIASRVAAGIALMIWGITGTLIAQAFFAGRYATGAYLGGVICLVLGFLWLMGGLLSRVSSRHRE
jgi:hypothetical protein